jgi:hypothetical protein
MDFMNGSDDAFKLKVGQEVKRVACSVFRVPEESRNRRNLSRIAAVST